MYEERKTNVQNFSEEQLPYESVSEHLFLKRLNTSTFFFINSQLKLKIKLLYTLLCFDSSR